MYCLGYHAFTRSTFTGDQHRGRNFRNLVNELVDSLHRAAVAEQTFNTTLGGDFLARCSLASCQGSAAGGLQRESQHSNIERLFQEVSSTVLKGPDHGFPTVMP